MQITRFIYTYNNMSRNQALHYAHQTDLFTGVTETRKQGWSSGRRHLGKNVKKRYGKGKQQRQCCNKMDNRTVYATLASKYPSKDFVGQQVDVNT